MECWETEAQQESPLSAAPSPSIPVSTMVQQGMQELQVHEQKLQPEEQQVQDLLLKKAENSNSDAAPAPAAAAAAAGQEELTTAAAPVATEATAPRQQPQWQQRQQQQVRARRESRSRSPLECVAARSTRSSDYEPSVGCFGVLSRQVGAGAGGQ